MRRWLPFGKKSSESKRRSSKRQAWRRPEKKLAMEPLEARELLSVAPLTVSIRAVDWNAYETENPADLGRLGKFVVHVQQDGPGDTLPVTFKLGISGTATIQRTPQSTDYDYSLVYDPNDAPEVGTVPLWPAADNTIQDTIYFASGFYKDYVIDVDPYDDLIAEPTEDVKLTLLSATSECMGQTYYHQLTPDQDTVYIADNEPYVSVSKTRDPREGDALPAKFIVSRGEVNKRLPLDAFLEFDPEGTSETLRMGPIVGYHDFPSFLGQATYPPTQQFMVHFDPNVLSVELPVAPYSDGILEGDENVRLAVLPGLYYHTNNPPNNGVTMTIYDAEMPSVWIDSTADAQEGVQAGYFRLRRDKTIGDVDVNYAIDTNWTTATNGVDFPYLPGTSSGVNAGKVTFTAGL